MSLGLFALLFWTMSFTPGPNMLLAMSFGLSVGLWRALPLVFGAVCGLVFVVVVCGIGVGAVFAANELVFSIFMCGCAAYLLFLATKMWKNTKNSDLTTQKTSQKLTALFIYGFTSYVTHPKCWAAFVALLPPFLDKTDPLNAKFALIVALVVGIEFVDMCIYALGGVALRRILATRVALLQRLGAGLVFLVGVLILFGVFWA